MTHHDDHAGTRGFFASRAGTSMSEGEQMLAFMTSSLLFMWGLRRGGLFPSLALAAAGTLAASGLKRRWPESMAQMLPVSTTETTPRLTERERQPM